METVDIDSVIEDVNAALPEGCEVDISTTTRDGKRVELIKGDTVTRLTSGLNKREAFYFLSGMLKGREIG